MQCVPVPGVVKQLHDTGDWHTLHGEQTATRHRGALTKLTRREGGAGAECEILPYVGHLQLISTLKIGADWCQLCQYKLTKPNLT